MSAALETSFAAADGETEGGRTDTVRQLRVCKDCAIARRIAAVQDGGRETKKQKRKTGGAATPGRLVPPCVPEAPPHLPVPFSQRRTPPEAGRASKPAGVRRICGAALVPAVASSLRRGPNSATIAAHMEIDVGMQAAIDEMKQGLAEGGIPIGSALVRDGKVIAAGHNKRVQDGDPITHAEIDCLRHAGRPGAGGFRGATLYSTLMPCYLCSGAAVQFGIRAGDRRREPQLRGRARVHAQPWHRGDRPGSARVRGDHGAVRPRPALALERGYRGIKSTREQILTCVSARFDTASRPSVFR